MFSGYLVITAVMIRVLIHCYWLNYNSSTNASNELLPIKGFSISTSSYLLTLYFITYRPVFLTLSLSTLTRNRCVWEHWFSVKVIITWKKPINRLWVWSLFVHFYAGRQKESLFINSDGLKLVVFSNRKFSFQIFCLMTALRAICAKKVGVWE